MCRVHPPRFPFQRHVIQSEYSLEPNPLKKIGPHCALVCSSEYDKISRLPVFYVDEKFTHQVIYFNTKSSIFYVKVKIYTSSLLVLMSSFLYLYGIQFFPCLHNFFEGICKKYMSSLYFHKSRRPGDDTGKRAQAVWKLRALKFNMTVTMITMNFFTTWRSFLKLFCRCSTKATQV